MFKKNKDLYTRPRLSSGAGVIILSGNIFESFGESIVVIFTIIFKSIIEALILCIGFIWGSTKILRKKSVKFLKFLLIGALTPIMGVYSRFERLQKNVEKISRQKGKNAAFKTLMSGLNLILFGEEGLLLSLFNIAAPVICVIFFFAIVNYNNSLEYAVKLEIDGDLYGYIENDQVFDEAEKYVDSRLNYLGSSKQINAKPVYTIEKVSSRELLNPIQVADMILGNSDISVQQAYGVYMNGSLVGAVIDNTGIKKALDGILDKYRSNALDEEVKFVQDINCELGGVYTTESLIDPELIIDQITSLKQRARYYTVTEGDSPSLISDKIDMTIAQIEELNPGFSKGDFRAGDKIQYSVDVAFLDVSVTRTETYETHTPYEVVYQNDEGMYVNTSRVIKKGEDGVSRVTAQVSRVNGEEKERKIISAHKLTDPSAEIIARGVKPILLGEISTEGASYGKYIWPVSRNAVRSLELVYEDGGYYYHRGVDFVTAYGAPIFAGDGGQIVLSGRYYDYGMTVIIEHPNGYRTLYAHCSQLFVSEGEYVSQGQQIAAVGQTGRAYGNHVHFEVMQGNKKYNPRFFLDGITVN
ncbi:MAG: peptidoglycan DD-metalloendopeptidase family protein [Eubacterium sp.]|jgi:murein DD-endopeptidase MepM/ murein hydrolase activator NlpD|nr:peptidoglycan DD-metalloendopeptidase family protein [Eubacterium sp.]